MTTFLSFCILNINSQFEYYIIIVYIYCGHVQGDSKIFLLEGKYIFFDTHITIFLYNSSQMKVFFNILL